MLLIKLLCKGNSPLVHYKIPGFLVGCSQLYQFLRLFCFEISFPKAPTLELIVYNDRTKASKIRQMSIQSLFLKFNFPSNKCRICVNHSIVCSLCLVKKSSKLEVAFLTDYPQCCDFSKYSLGRHKS